MKYYIRSFIKKGLKNTVEINQKRLLYLQCKDLLFYLEHKTQISYEMLIVAIYKNVTILIPAIKKDKNNNK